MIRYPHICRSAASCLHTSDILNQEHRYRPRHRRQPRLVSHAHELAGLCPLPTLHPVHTERSASAYTTNAYIGQPSNPPQRQQDEQHVPYDTIARPHAPHRDDLHTLLVPARVPRTPARPTPLDHAQRPLLQLQQSLHARVLPIAGPGARQQRLRARALAQPGRRERERVGHAETRAQDRHAGEAARDGVLRPAWRPRGREHGGHQEGLPCVHLRRPALTPSATLVHPAGRLAIKFHPDKNRDDPHAEDRFKEIAIAYQTLSEPELRRKYNEFGPKDSAPEGGFVDPEEVFGTIFGGDRFVPIIGHISLARDMKAALQEAEEMEEDAEGKPIQRDAKGREILSPEEKARRDEKARKAAAEVRRERFYVHCTFRSKPICAESCGTTRTGREARRKPRTQARHLHRVRARSERPASHRELPHNMSTRGRVRLPVSLRLCSQFTPSSISGNSSASRTAPSFYKPSASSTSQSRSNILQVIRRSSESVGGCTMCRASIMSSAKRACPIRVSSVSSLLRAAPGLVQGIYVTSSNGPQERVRADPGRREGRQPLPRGAAPARGAGRRERAAGALQGASHPAPPTRECLSAHVHVRVRGV